MSPLFQALPLRTQLEALRRDLATVANDLFGRRPPPFTVRVALGRHSRTIPSASELLGTRSVRIARIVRETPDAVSLELAFEGETPSFHPGQFMTLVVTLDGAIFRRAYSIHTAPHDGRIAVCVKRVKDGKVSRHLVDDAREGDVLQVLGPSGSFGLVPSAPRPSRVVLIAGGSGITPLASIARSLLGDRLADGQADPSRITLLFGNRTLEDVIFRDALEQLAAAHPERFELRHVLEVPPEDWTAGFGRLDVDTCARELARIDGLDTAEVFVCGPEGLMDSARAALAARGIDATRVHEEKFSSPGQRPGQRPGQQVSRSSITPQPITVRKGGKDLPIIANPEQTLLEAGLAAKVDMPFSCAMGGCAACKVKLLSGEVASDEPNCLTAQERADGWVLACVSRACEPVTIEVPEVS